MTPAAPGAPSPGNATSVAALLARAEARLAAEGIEGARLDAEVLLAHVMGVARGRVIVMAAAPGREAVAEDRVAAFEALVARRARREPVAYLTGRREFWSLDFEVSPAVLIPRPETEILVAEALRRLPAPGPRPLTVADVGTGSGAVAVSLAVERSDLQIAAIDVSAEALEIAGRNVRAHGMESRIRLLQGDLLAAAGPDRRFDMIVSNPPYVSLEERSSLMPDVRDHEPHGALFAGPGGMEVIERLVPESARALAPGGWLLFEISEGRAADTIRLLDGGGLWQDIGIRNDYSGLPRVACARRGSEDPLEEGA